MSYLYEKTKRSKVKSQKYNIYTKYGILKMIYHLQKTNPADSVGYSTLARKLEDFRSGSFKLEVFGV